MKLPIRGIAKKLGIHRRMVREAVLSAVPVGIETEVLDVCYFCRPDSSDFSMRTVAAGHAMRISLLRLLASASLSRSEIVRMLGTPWAKTRKYSFGFLLFMGLSPTECLVLYDNASLERNPARDPY